MVMNARKNVNRRNFIQMAGGTMAACSLPSFLTGCGGGDDGGSGVSHQRTLHFSLSTDGFLPENETYQLHVLGKIYPLSLHDDASRKLHGKTSSGVSHYAEDIQLPSNRATHIYVTQRTDHSGHIRSAHGDSVNHGFALSVIYIPKTLKSASASVRVLNSKSHRKTSGMVGALDDAAADTGPVTLDTGTNDEITPANIAAAIIFHHGNLQTMNPDQSAIVMGHIQEAPGLSDLIAKIKTFTRHTWYTMPPVLGDDDVPVTRSDGTSVYQYIVQPEILAAAQLPLSSTLNAVNNDPALKDLYYSSNVQDGTEPAASTASSSNLRTRLDAETEAGITYKLALGDSHQGLSTVIHSVVNNTVTLRFSSRYLRYLSIFVEFLDADGNPVVPADWVNENNLTVVANAMDTDSRKFLVVATPPPTFLGAPLIDAETFGAFTFPANASSARITAGGLGNGGYRNSDIEVLGVALTTTINLGIPTLLLAAAAAQHDDIKPFSPTVSAMLAIFKAFAGGIWSRSDHSPDNIMSQAGVFLGNILFKAALSELLQYITEQESEEAMFDAIPFIGWAMNAISIASTVAQLAETSAEVSRHPWITESRVSVTHDIDVNISHDPNDFEFPATATHYVVKLTFSHSTTISQTINLPGTTVSDTQTVTFKDVPAGGTVSVSVKFYSSNDWIAGQASTVGISNQNDAGQSKLSINLVLTENLVPLTSITVYSHKERLVYSGGSYAWQAGAAPVQTRVNLSSQIQAGSLASLSSVSVNQTLGRLSYSWQSHSGGVSSCGASASGVLGYAYRTIGLTSHPNVGLKFGGCYAAAPTLVENALFTNAAGVGSNLLIQPAGDSGWTVGYFPLDGAATYTSGGVLGVFPIQPDVVRRFSDERLIGISRAHQKIFLLTLAPSATSLDLAPQATLLSGPATSAATVIANPSLLLAPVTMAVGLNDAVIILEIDPANPGGAGQLRAFNSNGVPVTYFGAAGALTQGTSLRTPSRAVTYLDMHIEDKGYIFILSYEGTGSAVADYRMDIYKPTGEYLSATTGIAASNFSLDAWRNIYSLNFEALTGPQGDTEPSVSQWIPSTPAPQ